MHLYLTEIKDILKKIPSSSEIKFSGMESSKWKIPNPILLLQMKTFRYASFNQNNAFFGQFVKMHVVITLLIFLFIRL